jgi:hypothetical protein
MHYCIYVLTLPADYDLLDLMDRLYQDLHYSYHFSINYFFPQIFVGCFLYPMINLDLNQNHKYFSFLICQN